MMPQSTRRKREELRRYGRVLSILARYGFEDILSRLNATHEVPWRDLVFKTRARSIERLSTPQRLRLALEELGPTYVKFGQTLSSRPDLIPDDFVKELSKLQDNVAPFPFQDAKPIIEGQLGRPLGELYNDFEENPVAAASLAQVHRAKTTTGELVAVKVQRPGIEEVIGTDIDILRRLAALAERRLPGLAFYDPVAIVDEFAKTIRRELDFVREGRSADHFRKWFEGDPTVHVPKVHWSLTAGKVLTMEYINGIKVSDHGRLDALGVDRAQTAINGANLILKEIFEVRRFHADPHPGNLFVIEPNVIAPVDYGMIGTLDQETVDQLSVLITALVDKDVESLADVLVQICRATQPVNTRAIRIELAELLVRYYEVPLRQLNMKDITSDVMGILRNYNLRFPQELTMIMRSLMIIENVGCGLHPEFNVFEIMEPFARKLVIRKLDPAKRIREFGKSVDEVAVLMTTLPSDVREILAKIKQNEVAIQFEHRGLEHMRAVLNRSSNRLSFAVVIAALIIGSSIVFQTGVGPTVLGYPALGLAGFVMACVFGLWMLIGILRSGQL